MLVSVRALVVVGGLLVLISGCRQDTAPQVSTSQTPHVILSSPSSNPETAQLDPKQNEIQSHFRTVGPNIVNDYNLATLALHAPALFDHHVQLDKLHLYSDEPFEKSAGVATLTKVKEKLEASPIYQSEHSHSAFICNSQWREELFLQGAGRLGGLNYFPASHHVFLTGARIEQDALLSPRGFPIAKPRTLSYYIVHEFTHTLVGETVGAFGFNTMPRWLAEGYPDYVGLGPNYSYQQAQTAYYNRPEEIRATMAEDYMRYGVMVSYLLETQTVDIEALLQSPPSETDIKEKCGLR